MLQNCLEMTSCLTDWKFFFSFFSDKNNLCFKNEAENRNRILTTTDKMEDSRMSTENDSSLWKKKQNFGQIMVDVSIETVAGLARLSISVAPTRVGKAAHPFDTPMLPPPKNTQVRIDKTNNPAQIRLNPSY